MNHMQELFKEEKIERICEAHDPEVSWTSIPLISLFSGSGGMDLGFQWAGFAPVVAYDISEPAVQTYNHHRDSDIAKVADVSDLTASEIVADIGDEHRNGWAVGVIGGPPCQSFSQSNVYPKEDDIRSTLPGKFAELLRALNELMDIKFFVFENVRGLTYERHKEEFSEFRFLFEEAGFKLHEKLLNAKHFGLAQDRPRVFIVGINKNISGNGYYKFPAKLTQKPRPIRDVFEHAFGDLPWPDPVFFNKDVNPEEFPVHPNHWTMVPRSKKFSNGHLQEGQVNGRSFKVLSWDKPSRTVAYGNREIHIHPSGERRLSIFEAMMLQGFPKDYVLLGNFSQQVQLVSDAVPPPLAYHLAQSIRAFLEGHCIDK